MMNETLNLKNIADFMKSDKYRGSQLEAMILESLEASTLTPATGLSEAGGDTQPMKSRAIVLSVPRSADPEDGIPSPSASSTRTRPSISKDQAPQDKAKNSVSTNCYNNNDNCWLTTTNTYNL